MTEIISRCGLICSECPAYLATIREDSELKKQTAETWSKAYHANIPVEAINCLGCHSQRHFHYCDECKVRACSVQRGFTNCSECGEFPCDKEQEILNHVPGAKERLDSYRKKS